MATATLNGIRLHYELGGAGHIPVVLVHGSWDSLEVWNRIVPLLAPSFRVLAYDRRGHGRSERPPGQGSVGEDVADLAALIEQLGLAPAWVIGNSFGGSISLRLAAEHPDLLRGVIVHEPPLFALLGDDPALRPMLDEVSARIGGVVQRIAAGDSAGGAEQFVDTVALGPGTWAGLPPDVRRMLIENAPTFLDEANDPEQIRFDLDSIRAFPKPALLTHGDQSPPPFAPVVTKLAAVIPKVNVVTLGGTGHIPHETHPGLYVDTITRFIDEHRA